MALAILIATIFAAPSYLNAQTIRSGSPNIQTGNAIVTTQEREKKVNLRVKDSTIGYIVRTIGLQTNRPIVYKDADPIFQKRVSVQLVDMQPMDALAAVLKGTGLTVTLAHDRETIVIRAGNDADTTRSPQNNTISGQVVDSATRNGIAGATVTVIGTKVSGITSSEGHFTIRNVPLGKHTVAAKLFGYRSTSVPVTVTTGQMQSVSIVLASIPTALSEVVTTASGAQERVKIGNDIAKINVPEVLRNAPVTTMSELLTNRVPGLIVQKTSGAAGAPSIIRIRGIGSVSLNNDPIIIVDGVRIYSTISEVQDGSIVPGGLAPSALDGINPDDVESVEVMRGPSAAALYGTDAANGIIVVTTKRGQAGPTRWTVTSQQGRSWLPGSYPLFYKLWGRDASGRAQHCTIVSGVNQLERPCMVYDSIQTWQPLNDERTTLFGRGSMQRYSANVNGGTSTINYSLTISSGSQLGYAQMPTSEVERLTRITGNALPFWQRRPDGATNADGVATIGVQFNADANMTLTSRVGRQTTRSTPLVSAINQYFESPDPADSLITLNRVPDFRKRGRAQRLNSLVALNGTWRPSPRVTANGTVGWDRTSRDDDALLRNGDCPVCFQPEGQYSSLKNTSDVISASVSSGFQILRSWMLSGPTTIGLNYTQTRNDAIQVVATGLPAGGTSFIGASDIGVSGLTSDARVAGFFLDQRLSLFDRFYTGWGFRVDRGSGVGPRASAPTYPKLDFSIPVLTDERSWHGISTFRIRTAYGHSGKQPAIEARLRTFEPALPVTGADAQALVIKTLGNTRLRPERSVELEGGIDLGFWNNRIELGMTGYRKSTRDMLIEVTIPPSVYGGILSQQRNVGHVLNTGIEGSINAIVIDTDVAFWNVIAHIGANRNRLVSLSNEMKTAGTTGGGVGPGILAEGYPLFGYWIRPLVAYADINGDGYLEFSEIRRADSAVFLGGEYPKFTGVVSTSVRFFQRITLTSTFSMENGKIQKNRAWEGQNLSSAKYWKSLNDTTASLASTAAILDGSAFINRITSVRWDELSLSVRATPRIAHLFHANNLIVAIQMQNVRLWSNYVGKDPNVRARLDGVNGAFYGDIGQLPPPRSWMLRFELGR